ncbi:hypothetical protein CBL_20028 [Carabus blaptoides fortunei]
MERLLHSLRIRYQRAQTTSQKDNHCSIHWTIPSKLFPVFKKVGGKTCRSLRHYYI